MPALSVPYTFAPSTTILSAQVNNNFTAVQTAVNNVDNSQVGSLGFYASQIIPTSGTNATFGGAQRYTFANGLTVTGALSVSSSLGVTGVVTATNYIANGSFILLTYSGGATGTGFYQDTVNMAVKVTNSTGAFYIEQVNGSFAPLNCGAITSNGTIQTSGVLAYGNATLSSAAQIGSNGGSVRGIGSTAFYVYISSIGQQCAMDTAGNLGIAGGLWTGSVTSTGGISGTSASFSGFLSGTAGSFSGALSGGTVTSSAWLMAQDGIIYLNAGATNYWATTTIAGTVSSNLPICTQAGYYYYINATVYTFWNGSGIQFSHLINCPSIQTNGISCTTINTNGNTLTSGIVNATALNSSGGSNLIYNIQVGGTPGAGQFGIVYDGANGYLETQGIVSIVNHGNSAYMGLNCAVLTCSGVTCSGTVTAGQANVSGGVFNGSGYGGGGTPASSASFSCLSGGNAIIEVPSTSQSLYVRGNGGGYCAVVCASAGPSDLRWKEDVQEIPYGLNIVNQLKPKSFTWIEAQKKDLGLVAQDVELLLPELVSRDDHDYMLLNYNGIIPILIKAVQEQQAMIENLKGQVEVLLGVLQAHVKPDMNA